MDEGEAFIRAAASARGIDPEIAVRVARSEGGTMPPGLVGKFSTGWSFWQFQLHFGGPDYPQFGTVAGMGNSFAALTGWQPGDPRAWRDATRFALNRAKIGGWGPWYGAAAVGITGFDGIDRSTPWDASAERWDYEAGIPPMPTVVYNPDTPIRTQDHDWDCAEEAANWALHALGRAPSDAWLEQQMLADGIESRDVGLLDGSGRQLAAWITRQYGDPAEGTPTIAASNASNVSFDDVRSVAGQTAVLIGGHGWGSAGHWCGVRRYDPAADVLVLAQPGGTGPVYGLQTMTRQQFASLSPFSMVVLTADGAVPVPAPAPADPKDAIIADLRRQLTDKQQRLDAAISQLGYASKDVADAAQAIANTLRTLAPPAA